MHPHSLQNLCHCEGTKCPWQSVTSIPQPRQSRGWGIPSSVPLVPINASGGVLSVTSDRKYPKNAAKTNGFGFLARAWCGEDWDLLPPRIKRCNPVPCFRTVPAPIHRDALRAYAARPSRENPWVYRLVRCGHRALRNSIAIRCVGAGFYPARPYQVIHIFVGADDPVRPLYRAPCKTPVIAKPVRTPAVAIRLPVQLKNKHLTNPKNNPKMSVSFSSSRKRQRWGKGRDSSTQRESAAGASRWGSLAVLASELPA